MSAEFAPARETAGSRDRYLGGRPFADTPEDQAPFFGRSAETDSLFIVADHHQAARPMSWKVCGVDAAGVLGTLAQNFRLHTPIARAALGISIRVPRASQSISTLKSLAKCRRCSRVMSERPVSQWLTCCLLTPSARPTCGWVKPAPRRAC